MYFIAIDIGSSYIKSILLDLDKRQFAKKSRIATPLRKKSHDSFVFEVEAQVLYDTVRDIIADYCRNYDNIEGVLFSTQMHGCIYSDPLLGEDIYISWQDTRCLNPMPGTEGSYMDYLGTLFPPEDMRSTGVEIKPALALCNLYALLHEKNFATGERAEIFTLGSYMISRLTGCNICHITNAAPMGIVKLEAGDWRRDILEKIGMGGIKLPKIVQDFDMCGECEIEGKRLKVYPDFGDQQISVLGCMVGPGDLVVNIATGAQVILVDKGFHPGDYEVRPFFEGAYLKVVSRMPAGRNLDVLIEYLREVGEKVFDVSKSREEIWGRIRGEFTLEDTQGLAADVSFYELPHKLADGAILHINHYNMTLKNVFSAVLQDLGRVYARYINVVCGPDGLQGKLVFCGGTALNTPAIIQVIEKETALKATPAPMADEVYAGMLRAALVCTGRCDSISQTLERILM